MFTDERKYMCRINLVILSLQSMNVYVQYDVSRRDNSYLVSGVTRDVCSCPGQKGQLRPGTWGVTWSVDQPRMPVVVPDRRDNLDLGLGG